MAVLQPVGSPINHSTIHGLSRKSLRECWGQPWSAGQDSGPIGYVSGTRSEEASDSWPSRPVVTFPVSFRTRSAFVPPFQQFASGVGQFTPASFRFWLHP